MLDQMLDRTLDRTLDRALRSIERSIERLIGCLIESLRTECGLGRLRVASGAPARAGSLACETTTNVSRTRIGLLIDWPRYFGNRAQIQHRVRARTRPKASMKRTAGICSDRIGSDWTRYEQHAKRP